MRGLSFPRMEEGILTQRLPSLLVLILGIWGVIKDCIMFFMAFKGGGFLIYRTLQQRKA